MIYLQTQAEKAFEQSGPFTHLHTTPLEKDILYYNETEKALALNYIAISLSRCACSLLALALMSNHFHFILAGARDQVALFWEEFSNRMDIYYRSHGRPGLMKHIHANLTPITSLKQLRDEIAYVIRNAFVARTDIHVFADPWSSGYLYFNPMLIREGVPASALKGRKLRDFTCSRQIEAIDGTIYVKDGRAQMWSFVDYPFVESLYDNARQFINSVLKNVEAQVEVSRRIGEKPFLSDEELFPLMYKLCRDAFKANSPKDMDLQSRKKLAITLKNNYFASNKQLARLTQLPLKDIDTLFPLSRQADK